MTKPGCGHPEATLRLPRDYGWATSIADLAAIEPGMLIDCRPEKCCCVCAVSIYVAEKQISTNPSAESP
jgi:hypothetical protein